MIRSYYQINNRTCCLLVILDLILAFTPRRQTALWPSRSVSEEAPLRAMAVNDKIENNQKITEKKSFKRFMQIELWRSPELESIYPVLCSIELSCRDINRLMRRVKTDNLEGVNGAVSKATSEPGAAVAVGAATVNVQGEDQKKLDVIANRIMKITMCCSGQLNRFLYTHHQNYVHDPCS